MDFRTAQLQAGDSEALKQINTLFTAAFEDAASYAGRPPQERYLNELLSKPEFIAVAAYAGEDIAGAAVAYELKKFEQERSEIYIYDLAVSGQYRRRGVATQLIETLKEIARARSAYALFVQADKIDAEAIALYRSVGGTEQDVYHFDIPL